MSCAVKVKCVLFCLGSQPNSTEGSNRRLLVYQHCIPLCESGDLQTEVAADIIGLLMLEVKKQRQKCMSLYIVSLSFVHMSRRICLITILPLKCFTQTHTLSGPSLAQLASLFVEAIKVGKMGSGKSLELFPTVLTALSACEAVSYGKGKCKFQALVT